MTDTAHVAYSLRRRLLFGLLAAVATVWLATAAYSYFDARREINELLDAHLAQSASLIVAQVGHELAEIDLDHAPATHEPSRQVAFQVWEDGTELRLHSVNAPPTRLSPAIEGFSNATIDGRTWRIFSIWDAQHQYLVQVAERGEARRDIAEGIAASLLIPLLVALPLLGLFVGFSVGRGLKPLRRLVHDVEGRSPDNLGALDVDDAPAEVLPLVRGLNALFDRVTGLMESERRFTADAAHELRTPLAALKTQAQVARGAADDAARRHALDAVIAGCDRAARLVDQLLTLARLDPTHVERPTERCELAGIARQVLADLAPSAIDRKIDVELLAPEPISIAGHPGLLGVLVRNLVDNAIRYSPAESSVRVEVARSGPAALLSVTDEGPGIPPEEREKVGQRFYRVLGTGQSGSGLGLSIVRRIAEIHGAEVSLSEPANGIGLRVTLRFIDSGIQG